MKNELATRFFEMRRLDFSKMKEPGVSRALRGQDKVTGSLRSMGGGRFVCRLVVVENVVLFKS